MKAGASKWAQKIIRKGVSYRTGKLYPRRRRKRLNKEDSAKLTKVVEEYKSQGILVAPKDPTSVVVLDHFPVEKKSGGHRLVTNFVPANNVAVKPEAFKLIQPREVGQYLHQNAYLCSVDLSDAYNHLRLADNMPRMGIMVGKEVLEWKAMGFGLSHAPRNFVLLLREALKTIRHLGIVVLDYVDDLLVVGEDKEEAELATQVVVRHLERLGWSISKEKSVMTASTSLEYLGFTWNTTDLTVSIGRKKRIGLLKLVNKLYRRTMVSRRDVARVHGALMAATWGVHMGRYKTRELQMWLTKHGTEWDVKYPLTQEIREELVWWRKELSHTAMAHPFQPSPVADVVIHTDASDTGYGALLEVLHGDLKTPDVLQGHWNKEWAGKRIETKELWIACQALTHYITLLQLKKATVKIFVDSQVALSYLVKMKGGRKRKLNRLLSKTWKLMRERERDT